MIEIFDYLVQLFNEHGFNIYMVGGLSRDYLLDLTLKDYDFVSDALPSEITKFLDCDDCFIKYGVIKTKVLNKKIEIVTLRKESDYIDHRHPSKIEFIKDINIDYLRRDFTINALYIDKNYNVIDPSKLGIADLKNRFLRFIGDPLTRIKEDPLRILRAYRFIKKYNLTTSNETLKLLKENEYLLNELNKEKIKEEIRKESL